MGGLHHAFRRFTPKSEDRLVFFHFMAGKGAITDKQAAYLASLMGERCEGRKERIMVLRYWFEAPNGERTISSTKHLSKAEASAAIDIMQDIQRMGDPFIWGRIERAAQMEVYGQLDMFGGF